MWILMTGKCPKLSQNFYLFKHLYFHFLFFSHLKRNNILVFQLAFWIPQFSIKSKSRKTKILVVVNHGFWRNKECSQRWNKLGEIIFPVKLLTKTNNLPSCEPLKSKTLIMSRPLSTKSTTSNLHSLLDKWAQKIYSRQRSK